MFAAFAPLCPAQPANPVPATNGVQIVVIQGSVEVQNAGGPAWRPARINEPLQPLDRVHTAANSRVALRWADQSIVTFGASSEFEILPANAADADGGFNLLRGITSFFHRDKPGRIRVIIRGAEAGVEGTEFVLAASDAGNGTLSVIDGRVKLANPQGALLLTNGEQAVVAPGQAPARTAGFVANNVLQWCFYYPAVIDPKEVPLAADETNTLAGPLAAYRSGDLLAALADYPASIAETDPEKLFHAALLLAVGEVPETETILGSLTDHSDRVNRLAGALRQLIAAVKLQPSAATNEPVLASELLADSYFEQSRAVRETSLENALRLAARATVVSPDFGFAWARLAELEFSFGRTDAALAALDRSLALAPRNAQALALKGFILNAENEPRAARDWFDRAINVDSALGNAWLGRGLARIRLGDAKGGRADLLVAAALEPQRAELRSYLGKAYTAAGDDAHATKELNLAKKLDPNDPTGWLYSALHNQQQNHINQAIRDLEKSQSLNDNRSVYRSQLLLDQDSAVRSANLANIYQDAGMYDTAVNEAGRAVSSDYANYSAHLFLAGSYNQLRSPDFSNTRFDTPTTDEFWLANLLAPASAGWLSPTVAERPYANLFDQNRFGLVSDTTYLSRGAWTENAEEYYTSDKFDFDFGTSYLTDPGQRANENFEQREFDISAKGQLTPKDSLFGTIQLADIKAGDVSEAYSQNPPPNGFHLRETQEPNLFLGFHHEWSPGVHTLLFATRQTADEPESSTNLQQYLALYGDGSLQGVHPLENYESARLKTREYSAELQQIWEGEKHATIIGGRYDWGDVRYQNMDWNNLGPFNGYNFYFASTDPLVSQDFQLDFNHFDLYGYHTWQIADPFSITAGVTFDWLRSPADVITTPFFEPSTAIAGGDALYGQNAGDLNNQESTKDQISPKVGFVWTPTDSTVLRAAYTRSMSDFTEAQNNQLEPTEVAGFNQAFGSLIPEAVIADSSGSTIDTFNAAFEQNFSTGTYLILSGDILYSKVSDIQGAFAYFNDSPTEVAPYPLGLTENLSFRERTAAASLNQLVGDQWTFGAKYSISQANLNINYPQIPAGLPAGDFSTPYYGTSFYPNPNENSVLQLITLRANWNHPCGLFSVLEGNWYHQGNFGFSSTGPATEPGDAFWQMNACAGYRCWHRRLEFSVGVLNLTDQNYQLEPLNLYNEMARSRTFLARLLISF